MFKNGHVGRPSNAELKSRRNKKIIMVLIPVVFIVAIVLTFMSDSFKNLMGNSVIKFECENGTNPIEENGKKVCQVSLDAILLGDVNLDGNLDISDLTLMQKVVSDDLKIDEHQFAAADINKNDNIESLDIELLTKYLNGEEVISTYKTYNLGTEKTCIKGYQLTGDKCVTTVDAKRVETVETVYGDVNLDGKVNETDLDYLTKNLAKFSGYDLTEQGRINADLNVDDIVDAKDRMILARYLNKMTGYEQLPYKGKIEETETLKNAVYGDVNLDGKVNETDLDYLTKNLANYSGYDLTEQGKINADLNADDKVDAKDRMILSRYLGKTDIQNFTIKYNANGGTGKMNDQDIVFGVDTKLSKNNFTKANSKFLGWRAYNNNKQQWACYKNTEKTSQGYTNQDVCNKYGYVIYKDQATVSKTGNSGEVITMYAQWSEIKTFKLKYDANGGTGQMNDQDIVFGVDTKLNKNKFTKKNYIFDGWISYNNTTGKWYCYTNSKKTTKGKVDKATCEKYGYVKYRDQATVSKSANPGETVTFLATWIDPAKAVTIKFTPETSSTTVYSRYKYKIGISLTLNSSINNYYYKWITYKDGKVSYNGTCTKATTKSMTYTLDMVGKRYGQIAIYSDSKCSAKVTSQNTKTYNLSSVIWPVTPKFQLLEHDKMVTRKKHYAYGISEGHEGLDITIPVGTPVYAISDGTICSTYSGNGVNNDEDYGNALIQTTKINGKSYRIIYAHLKNFVVKSGKVTKGQLIAYSGMTGGTRIPHVHIDIRNTSSCSINSGSQVSPLNILPSINNFKNLKSSVSRSDYTKTEFPDSSIDLYNRMYKAQKSGSTWNYKIYGRVKKNYKISNSLTLKKGTIVELVSRARYRRYQLKIKYNNKIYSNLDETYFEFVWNN